MKPEPENVEERDVRNSTNRVQESRKEGGMDKLYVCVLHVCLYVVTSLGSTCAMSLRYPPTLYSFMVSVLAFVL